MAPELWGLEIFLWLCFGDRQGVCVGGGVGEEAPHGSSAPRFPGFCPLVAMSELQLQDQGKPL